jgi:hypothetical protein
MKTCTKCNKSKSLDNFSINRSKKDGHNYVCKDCKNEYTKQHYSDNKSKYLEKAKRNKKHNEKIIREYIKECKKGKSCPYCGETDTACFDFHHRDVRTKLFNIAASIRLNKTLKLLKVEIEKCVLLCSNCHRKHHAGRLKL